MFDAVSVFLIDFVDILKVFIPLVIVFDIAGDLLWR